MNAPVSVNYIIELSFVFSLLYRSIVFDGYWLGAVHYNGCMVVGIIKV